MMFSSLTSLVCWAVYASAAPTNSPYVVHERREVQTEKWTRRGLRLARDVTIPMSIGLTQRNLENGYDLLMDVSHPESPNYGKHWSMNKIAETFASSPKTIDVVRAWIMENGISHERIKLSKGLNWIKFNATVEEVESLLRTEYRIYTDVETGKDHLACEDYSIPPHLKEHIDFITPTVHFDAVVKTRPKRRDLEKVEEKHSKRVMPFPFARQGAEVSQSTAFTMANCYQYTTPDCIRSLYNFTNGTLAKSSFGIVEYTPQAQRQSDLNLFYANLQRQIPSGYAPNISLIDGAIIQNTTKSFAANGESDLDLEYAIALVYPQKVTLYQVGDMIEGASFGNFLDAIDASYCKSGGGDDPYNDATYPDTTAGGYKGPEACGTITPASVISTSYGYNEADLPAAYKIRQCNEYMKLGLAGTTFIFSSGDYGVAGSNGACCTTAKCAGGKYNSGTNGTFNPAFPSTCPYVTSVGATQVKPNTAVTTTNPEQACQTVIYSGGGFSNQFAIPSYQSSAVAAYFKSYKPTYTATIYNNSQTVRAYPDVAAIGANYVVGVDDGLSLVYGTSASAPVFGAIISLINQQRIAAGKAVVGFINPTLYANPTAFTDIISGGNQGCGTPGFTAVAGWDPVTGLGTPIYSKLLKVFMALS